MRWTNRAKIVGGVAGGLLLWGLVGYAAGDGQVTTTDMPTAVTVPATSRPEITVPSTTTTGTTTAPAAVSTTAVTVARQAPTTTPVSGEPASADHEQAPVNPGYEYPYYPPADEPVVTIEPWLTCPPTAPSPVEGEASC